MEDKYAEPLFTKVQAEGGENWRYICLYWLANDTNPPCGNSSSLHFDDFLNHMATYHGVTFVPIQEYCPLHEYVFPQKEKIFAIEHWLVHAIDIAAESELKEGFELNDTLDKLNDIRTEILENIIQCDESPP